MSKVIQFNPKDPTKNKKNLEELIAEARLYGRDGHITIYSFTTCWKVMAGTPDFNEPLRPYREADPYFHPSETYRALWEDIPPLKTLEEALEYFIEISKVEKDLELL